MLDTLFCPHVVHVYTNEKIVVTEFATLNTKQLWLLEIGENVHYAIVYVHVTNLQALLC